MNDLRTFSADRKIDWRDMLSACPEHLYRSGGFYDGEVMVSRLHEIAHSHKGAVQIVAELFPPLPVERPMPVFLDGPDSRFLQQVLDSYHHINGFFSTVAASAVVRIRNAAIYDNIVFLVQDGVLTPIYEMLRAVDRPVKGQEMAVRASQVGQGSRLEGDGSRFLFIGSVGSSNYGHWLVDDFPCIKAMEVIDGCEPITVLMSSYGEKIDAIRSEGAALGRPQSGQVKPMFLSTDRLFFVDDLYYVTPVSYHPILKHPQALAYTFRICDEREEQPSAVMVTEGRGARKLFVNRSAAHSRHITNNDDVKAILLEYGFEEVFPENLSFSQQVSTFREASHVVGVMGAAMASALFCPPNAQILYLAPNGWSEPFYWDLAAMRGHSYNALFGVTAGNSELVHLCAFAVNTDQLRGWLQRALT